ncbi:MAG: tetratricopeptide repeat protein [Nannocystaceae bacterium]
MERPDIGERRARRLRELAPTAPASAALDAGCGPESAAEPAQGSVAHTPAPSAAPDAPPRSRDVVARLNYYRGFAGLFGGAIETPRLGKYEVVDLLGCGGNGVVLVGRNPDLDEEVAIKVLRLQRAEGGGKQGARLLREARVLAKLKHPNIVPILDAGEEDGELYIVMRRVRGATLHDVQQGKPWREVVDLYVAAARGLAAVHAAGLVHRDFKADNVLVDEDGSVLLADFGLVCEARDDEGGAAPLLENLRRSAFTGRLTGEGFPGTPAYMAPETLDGAPADARWDIYSLSASLYEGLYARVPYTGDTDIDILLAAERGDAPPRPRGSQVPEWLDAAVRRGLDPDPAGRYASVEAMIDALDYRRREREEAAEVAAREAAEASRRRGRRHLAGSLGAVVVAFTLGAALYMHTQEGPCERDDLAAIWGEDAQDALGDGDVAERLRGLIDAYAGRWRGSFAALCAARERQSPVLYDARMACLAERRVTLAALIRAATDEPTEDDLDDLLVAAASLEDPRACEAATATPQPDAAQAEAVGELRRRLGELPIAERSGDYVATRALARAIVDAAKEVGYDPLTASALIALGRSEWLNSSGDGAVEALREAANIAERAGLDGLAADASSLLTKVAALLLRDGKLGEEWAEQSARKLDRIDADGRRRAELLNNRGLLAYEVRGDFDAAEEAHLGALRLRRELQEAGDEARLLVADSLLNLGNADSARGRFDAARSRYAAARRVVEDVLGPQHPRVADLLLSEAMWLNSQGRWAEAIERGRAVLDIYAARPVPAIAEATIHYFLSSFYQSSDAYDAAVAEARAAVTLIEGASDATESDRAWVRDRLGAAERELYVRLRDAGDDGAEAAANEALDQFDRALAALERAAEPDDEVLVSVLNNRGDLLRERGRYDEALDSLERCERLLAGRDALRARYLSRTLKGRALVELARGEPTDAEATLTRATAALPPDADWGLRVELLFRRAEALRAGGRGGEAKDLAREALARAEQHELTNWALDISAWLEDEDEPKDGHEGHESER